MTATRHAVRRRLRGLRARLTGSASHAPRRAGSDRATTGAVADLGRLLEPYVPDDHARQVSATYYLDLVMGGPDAPKRVMDLGCGSGDSVDRFRTHDPAVDWVGVDIADSQEAMARRRSDAVFVTYDGSRIPFDDATFDLVYSRQVIEHVPDPEAHLREIARTLRPAGRLIGSTSQLEPYHSRSYGNLTPYGFAQLAAAAGLQVRELRPGIDGVTLTMRTFLGRPAGFDRWWESESPLNQEIDAWGRDVAARPALVNVRKLHVCGQFAFLVVKEPAPDA